MILPQIIINTKCYKEATGSNAIKLAKALEAVAKSKRISIAIAVPATDIAAVSKAVKIPVLAQHVDPVDYGAFTGHIPPLLAKKLGASGTLLNHSERPLDLDILQATIDAAHDAGLWVCGCAGTIEQVGSVAACGVDMVAVEPPELIGGNVSISKAEPDIILRAKRKAGKTPLFCGAGVHSSNDVSAALKLGAEGVLVAHAVAASKNPKKAVLELVKGFKD